MFRHEFPILKKKIYNNKLTYFDNAATTQTPISVVKAIEDYYFNVNANVHRGAHFLSQEASSKFEQARENIAKHFKANANECIFTRGTTHGINLLARGVEHTLRQGDEIILSCFEHHSNLVIFQEIAKTVGATIKYVPITPEQEFDYKAFENMVNGKTKIIALPLISNVLGEKLDTKKIKQVARYCEDAYLFYDAAQLVGHEDIDFTTLGCHALTCSAHKCYGPTGIGCIIATQKLIKEMTPYEYGGGMIESVEFEKTQIRNDNLKFEAGTPDICGAIAFSKAIEFIEGVSIKQIKCHEEKLIEYFLKKAIAIEGFKLYGTKNVLKKAGVFSFTYKNYNCYDVATLLNMKGVAIREGAHCAQPLLKILNVTSTCRVSFALYNTIEEIDDFFECLHIVDKMLQKE